MFVQLCDPAHHLWRLQLHCDHEGLHRRWTHAEFEFKHGCVAQPEDLGGAENQRTGCKRDRRGDRLMLGNQSELAQQHSEIQLGQEWVRKRYGSYSQPLPRILSLVVIIHCQVYEINPGKGTNTQTALDRKFGID